MKFELKVLYFYLLCDGKAESYIRNLCDGTRVIIHVSRTVRSKLMPTQRKVIFNQSFFFRSLCTYTQYHKHRDTTKLDTSQEFLVLRSMNTDNKKTIVGFTDALSKIANKILV